jgi:bile acid:Na+ symporter, BASS family
MERALRWAQGRLLWLLLGMYVLGAFAPAFGLRIRGVQLGHIHALGGALAISLPMLMLGALLLVAALGARLEELKRIVRKPGLLVVGLAANALYPVAFATSAAALLVGWHSIDEAQNILMGLAMVGAMPIAGASTAWSQNADGNLALSLGLVWGSTLLSPLLTPLGLQALAFVTRGDYAADLHKLARQGSSLFVLLAVVLPSLLGLVGHAIVSRRHLVRAMPTFKLFNLGVLLLLNYTNAAVSLPRVVVQPDLDFMALLFGVTISMCAGAFALGWWIPRRFRSTRGDQTALMFGLGMSNNGAGLVLAAAALPAHPLVLVSIMVYNVVQQMLAGVVDAVQRRSASEDRQKAAGDRCVSTLRA